MKSVNCFKGFRNSCSQENPLHLLNLLYVCSLSPKLSSTCTCTVMSVHLAHPNIHTGSRTDKWVCRHTNRWINASIYKWANAVSPERWSWQLHTRAGRIWLMFKEKQHQQASVPSFHPPSTLSITLHPSAQIIAVLHQPLNTRCQTPSAA